MTTRRLSALMIVSLFVGYGSHTAHEIVCESNPTSVVCEAK